MPLQGKLDARGHPRVDISVSGPYGSTVISAIVDTGFTVAIGIPSSVASKLGLRRWNVRPSILADGTLRSVTIYLLEVGWMGRQVTAEAWDSAGVDATIGAGLLQGLELRVDYGPARSVEIR